MNTSGKTPLGPEAVGSLKTIPVASKSGDARSYHPAYRSLSLILDEDPPSPAVQVLPSFLICESGPLARPPGAGRPEFFFRVDSFDDAVAAYAEPLAD